MARPNIIKDKIYFLSELESTPGVALVKETGKTNGSDKSTYIVITGRDGRKMQIWNKRVFTSYEVPNSHLKGCPEKSNSSYTYRYDCKTEDEIMSLVKRFFRDAENKSATDGYKHEFDSIPELSSAVS